MQPLERFRKQPGTHSRLRIVLSGMIAADPLQGGAAWAVLQYLHGLARLGHEVVFVEQLAPDSVQPQGAPLERSDNAAYFQAVMRNAAPGEQSALLLAGTDETVGLPYGRLAEAVAEADLLLNISGILTDERLLAPIGVRAYLDLDPAFNQLWQAQGIDMRFGGHTHFVTVGAAIGTSACPVPALGHDWIATVPPVVLEHWPTQRATALPYTTIGNWRGYGSVEQNGVHYGQKAHSMRALLELSERVSVPFLLALAIHAGEQPDLEALAAHGWQLADPAKVAATPDDYRRFIQASRGELGVAKSGYVLSRCGWFSDRSTCYLASGRPVLAQETGYETLLPTGEGLLSFHDVDSAVACIEDIESDYARHARAARAIAEEHFDSDRVLGRLIDRLGAA